MKFSTKIFSVSGITIAIASMVWGVSEGLTLGASLGQTTGTMVGFGLVWFVYTRAEFQINQYLQRRSVQKSKGNMEDDDYIEHKDDEK